MEIINRQRKKRQNTLIATICHETITKIVTFITSILIGNVFPSFKIWLPQVMASLSRKPQLLGSLQQLLTVFHVTSHTDTDRHKRKLANSRMEKTDPIQRLIEGKNIWNLAVIDNIDFKERHLNLEIYIILHEKAHMRLYVWLSKYNFQ
ncbi:hypothetical protein RclHR1_03570009 [Rhizophagus clarus]|uniref:Uncharacterized protein n=1 Tax=Rhizophagus clarus TaxID=94130 RepID=A0A2Z6RSS9_9GLOM|nr:hypothetical protein RclHR1_03570009 [Rhizophagus clarus]